MEQYKGMENKIINYPIIEALCEFKFTPAQSWDITIPGIFYERIKSEFPTKEQQVSFGVGFSPQKGTIEQKVELQQRIRFWRKDKSIVIQVGPNLLAMNHLKPYRTWEAFKPIILNNLKAYIEIVKPKSFNRIVLRYINQIVIDNYKGELSDYFNFYPLIPRELPRAHGPFNVRVEFPTENRNELLLLNFACSSISNGSSATDFRLELNYILKNAEALLFDQADDWIEKAKRALNDAFKACITEKCWRIFGGDKYGIHGIQ
ncbi:MAG: TIGR04255 family protein [Deltaproteobacteria bacterium]|nr:TIGR04255 family protein [Deltaproteobacteria bacterium]